MGVIIVSVGIMRIMTMIIVMISLWVPASFFSCLADHICLIPRCLDKYLECRVEVHDEYEEHDCDDDEYDEEKELEVKYRNKCKEARDQKWDHEEYDRHDEGTQV